MRRPRWFGGLTVAGLLLAGLLGLAPATSAATTIIPLAGTGVAGFSGDDGPAAQAEVNAPDASRSDADGNVYFVDRLNRRVRKIDSGGTITTIVGDGTACGPVQSPDQPLTGLCPGGGLAVAQDGSAIFFVQGGGIERAVPGGPAYHFAGKYTGSFGPYDDGPKFDVALKPQHLWYDDASGELYFTEQTDVRKVTLDGRIVTVAGAVDNSSGQGNVNCTVGPVDGSLALGACLGPTGLVIHNGTIYLTDMSYYHGGTRNAPTVWSVSGGRLHRLAGGNCFCDVGLGGSALQAGFSSVAHLALSSHGELAWMAPAGSGQIVKLAADGTVQRVTDVGAFVSGLTFDGHDDLVVALESANRLVRVSGLYAPPPPPKPVVAGIVPDEPSPVDPLLTRGVMITPASNGAAINHYEYGWAPAGPGVTAPTKPVQQTRYLHARLNYGVTSPDADWLLFARAVAVDGTVGDWSQPTAVHTPKAPLLIALGDSITSGHHNDMGANGKTSCEDPNYGYAAAFSQRWIAALPPQWRVANQYQNLAFSGFATQPRAGSSIKGSVLAGGENACGATGIPSPLATAVMVPGWVPNSWNRVVVTAGVDDTNWVPMLKNLVGLQLTAEMAGGHLTFNPLGWQYGSLTQAQCQQIISQQWDGTKPEVKVSIADGVAKIVAGLRTADPAVKITWVDYYNIAGTGMSRVNSKLPPVVPEACRQPIDQALNTLHQVIQSALPGDVTFVATDSVMQGHLENFQTVYLPTEVLHSNPASPPGWPHPTQSGGDAIAALLDPQ